MEIFHRKFLATLLFVVAASLSDAKSDTSNDVASDASNRRFKRQIFQAGNGVVIKDWWILALYKIIPFIFKDDNSVPTPIMFLPYTDQGPTMQN